MAEEVSAEILLRIHQWGGRYDFTPAERAEIEAMSVTLLGKPVRDCSCPDRWGDAVKEMGVKFKNQIKMATANKYNLAKGVVIDYEGKYYTHVNITDEVAKAYLEKFPKRAKLFVSIPSDAAKAVKAAKKAETAE